MAKKETTKKTEPKKPAPKKTVIKKEVAKKPVIKKESKVKLISATIGATIPTMTYGNLPVSYTVEAPSIEEANEMVLPIIEKLYEQYAYYPLKTASIPEVQVVEKQVDVPAPKHSAETSEQKEVIAETPEQEVEDETDQTQPYQDETDQLSKELSQSPAYSKALGAINSTMSDDALSMIETQIQKSSKLLDTEKPQLLAELLKKRKQIRSS